MVGLACTLDSAFRRSLKRFQAQDDSILAATAGEFQMSGTPTWTRPNAEAAVLEEKRVVEIMTSRISPHALLAEEGVS
jgi:hypothetical protein